MASINWGMVILILLISTLTGSIGALVLKAGMGRIVKLTLGSVVKSGLIWGGVLLYIVSAVSNIFLYKYLPYSIGFPMTSLTYVWTVILSYFVFKEKISAVKVIAILCIIAGVIIISR